MVRQVVTIPQITMSGINHKKIAIFACFDPEDRVGLVDRSIEIKFLVREVYGKPQWKLAQLYLDYEGNLPLAERKTYQDFLKDAMEGKFDILYMWSLRQLSLDAGEIKPLLEHLRKYRITLRTHIEEFDTSVISDNLILDIWAAGQK